MKLFIIVDLTVWGSPWRLRGMGLKGIDPSAFLVVVSLRGSNLEQTNCEILHARSNIWLLGLKFLLTTKICHFTETPFSSLLASFPYPA